MELFLIIKKHLLSTACTAERRQKSHRYDACGRQEKTVCQQRWVSAGQNFPPTPKHCLGQPEERFTQNAKHGALNELDSNSCVPFLLLGIYP